jgi:capsular exopolysaccharide synthesis family protein
MGLIRELGLEPQMSAKADDQESVFVAQNSELVVLRTDPVYPLLIDPTQKEAAEHFGVLRTRLLNARAKSGTRSVLISSPQKQEGKSFTCLNLAISLAQLEKGRVLLIDGDLRIRGISGLLGLRGSTGLADFLQGRTSFESCIRATTLPHLFVVPAGNVAEESLPALLEGSRWPEFVRKAEQEFGMVIVDSVPASAPIADFELLLAACDAALLIVHLRKTTREALDITVQQLNDKLLGVIVNNAGPRVSSDYYSYYGSKKST